MRRVVALVGVALLLAGCGVSGGGVRDEGAAAVGSKAAVSPAAAAGQGTAAVPTQPAAGAAFVYFLRYDQPEPTRRSIAPKLSVPEGSLRALLTGPTLAERVLHYSTAIPATTTLLGYSVVNRTAIVDVSAMPPVVAGDQGEALLALYQIVYTVTASGGIEAVQVRVNGQPYGLNALAGGSSALEPPLTRADLSFVVDAATLTGSAGCAVVKKGAPPFRGAPSLTLTRPKDGERVSDAIQVRGTVQGKGGPLVIRVLQDSLEVANRVIDDTCRGSFAATIPVPRTLAGEVGVVVIAPGVEGSPAASAQRRIVATG
ncbi:MAG: GerMN domain-containing protein [Gaiellales bacterium]